jgi:hypothetical protein
MGKNNRARRAAKAKDRRAQHRSTGPSRGGPTLDELTPEELAHDLFSLAVQLGVAGDAALDHAVATLAQLPPSITNNTIEDLLLEVPDHLWCNGWQPAEIVRQVRRKGNAALGRLTAVLVCADHLDRPADTLHPQWAQQVTELEQQNDVSRRELRDDGGGWFASWQRQEGLSRHDAIRHAVQLDALLHTVGALPQILPPPGSADAHRTPRQRGTQRDDPILTKVRALLAQAESTTFPAEAEAFTAKAQELMTRHAIDHALLAGTAERSDHPITRRIPIDDPYVDAKSLLLQNVAKHSRCRAVYDSHHAMSSVVGFEHDLAAAELLFTSLLVQAQVALTAEGHDRPAGSRVRSRSFRSSFLVAYAVRIGERLEAINDEVFDSFEPDARRAALPVLAARRSEVDDVVDELFGELRSSRVSSGWDGLGGARGAAAADRARLNIADLPARATG